MKWCSNMPPDKRGLRITKAPVYTNLKVHCTFRVCPPDLRQRRHDRHGYHPHSRLQTSYEYFPLCGDVHTDIHEYLELSAPTPFFSLMFCCLGNSMPVGLKIKLYSVKTRLEHKTNL